MTTQNRPRASRKDDNSTSHSLIQRLQGNESHAWDEMVELYSPLIAYWCRKSGMEQHLCEDLVQEIFHTVIKSIDRFHKEQPSDTFRGWLRTITRSRIVDYQRRQSTEPDAVGGTEANLRLNAIGAAETYPNFDAASSNDEDEQSVLKDLYRRAIQMIRCDFSEQTFQAFWRVAVDGCNATEVANELGMTSGAVRVAKSRVLKRLRDQLGDYASE